MLSIIVRALRWLWHAILILDGLFVEPVALMVLHSVRPLLERFWRVDVNADVIEGLGKTARKEAQVHNKIGRAHV